MSLQGCNCLGTRSSSSRRNWPNYVKIGHDPIVCVNKFMARLKIPSWRTCWRKIKRKKKRLLSCSPAVHHVHVPYDPNTYSQNFDDGSSTDPDNALTSFSARFAVPSRIFEKNQEEVG